MGSTFTDADLARLAGRNAALACLALWVLAEAGVLLPDALRGRIGPDGILLYRLIHAAIGLGLDAALFALIRRDRHPAIVGAALGLAIAAHTLASAFLYLAWFHPTRAAGEHEGLGIVEMLLVTQGMAVTPTHLIFVACAYLVLRNAELRRREQLLAASQAAAEDARLSALRLQINPHFLFNVLNTVTSLIEAGRPEHANLVVGRLAEFFRDSMTAVSRRLIPLADELDTISAYLDIEAVRFGDRLAVEIDAPDAVREALVPHLLLQPLVENAVKHGVAPSKRPVTVRIRARAEDGWLIVQVADDGCGAPCPDDARGGVGLANVRSRLEALYGSAAALTAAPAPTGFVAEIRLPLQHET